MRPVTLVLIASLVACASASPPPGPIPEARASTRLTMEEKIADAEARGDHKALSLMVVKLSSERRRNARLYSAAQAAWARVALTPIEALVRANDLATLGEKCGAAARMRPADLADPVVSERRAAAMRVCESEFLKQAAERLTATAPTLSPGALLESCKKFERRRATSAELSPHAVDPVQRALDDCQNLLGDRAQLEVDLSRKAAEARPEYRDLEALEQQLEASGVGPTLAGECARRGGRLGVVRATLELQDRVARIQAACAEAEARTKRANAEACRTEAAANVRSLPPERLAEAIVRAIQPECPAEVLEETARTAVERGLGWCAAADPVAGAGRTPRDSPTVVRAFEECGKTLLALLPQAAARPWLTALLRDLAGRLGVGARLGPAPRDLPALERPPSSEARSIFIVEGADCLSEQLNGAGYWRHRKWGYEDRGSLKVRLLCGIDQVAAGETTVKREEWDLIQRGSGPGVSKSLTGGYVHTRTSKAKLRQYRRVTRVHDAETGALLLVVATKYTQPTLLEPQDEYSLEDKPEFHRLEKEVTPRAAELGKLDAARKRTKARRRWAEAKRTNDALLIADAATEVALYAPEEVQALEDLRAVVGLKSLPSRALSSF